MARKIKQFQYYPNNVGASNVDMSALNTGNAFTNFMPIVQLGIQTLPGVIFRINGAANPIMVGSTGIYEIDVSNGAAITSLQFDANSLNMINNSGTGYLIIDILYEK